MRRGFKLRRIQTIFYDPPIENDPTPSEQRQNIGGIRIRIDFGHDFYDFKNLLFFYKFTIRVIFTTIKLSIFPITEHKFPSTPRTNISSNFITH